MRRPPSIRPAFLIVFPRVHLSPLSLSLCRCCSIDGKTTPKRKQELKEAFQENPAVQVAVVGLTAAGVGLSFTAAATSIFAELHWTPVRRRRLHVHICLCFSSSSARTPAPNPTPFRRMYACARLLQGVLAQAEDRIHRIGQRAAEVNIHYLVGDEASFDEKLWRLVAGKLETLHTTLDAGCAAPPPAAGKKGAPDAGEEGIEEERLPEIGLIPDSLFDEDDSGCGLRGSIDGAGAGRTASRFFNAGAGGPAQQDIRSFGGVSRHAAAAPMMPPPRLEAAPHTAPAACSSRAVATLSLPQLQMAAVASPAVGADVFAEEHFDEEFEKELLAAELAAQRNNWTEEPRKL